MPPRRSAGPVTPATDPLPGDWSWFSAAPLVGCRLLRERHQILAWDDTNILYLLSLDGVELARKRAPRELAAVAAADTGTRIIAASKKGEIWWLDDRLLPLLEVRVRFAPLGVAVDPHGQYVAVSSTDAHNAVFTSQGRARGAYETSRPLRHLAFVPETGEIIGVADDGLVTCDTYRGRNVWYETQWSNVGDMALAGDGSSLLLSCFGHGIARYNARGRREGAYRQEDSPALVSLDYDGRLIISSSLEKRLTVLDSNGRILGTRDIDLPPLALHLDAVGRYAVLAFAHGEIRLIRVDPLIRPAGGRRSGREAAIAGPAPGQIAPRPGATVVGQTAAPRLERGPGGPVISFKAVPFEDDARQVLLTTIPQSDAIGYLDGSRTLRVVSAAGELMHRSPALRGVGGTLRSRGPWLALATDTSLLGYNPLANESWLADHLTYELSHFDLFEEPGELVFVEGSQVLVRMNLSAGRRWQRPAPGGQVLALAAASNGDIAVTIDGVGLQIVDALGDPLGGFETRKPVPLDVRWLEPCWVTISRDEQLLRGHDRDGHLLWATNTPWPVWRTQILANHLVVANIRGQALLIDAQGRIVDKNDEERDQLVFALAREGAIARIYANQQTLIATRFDGRLLWRQTFDKLLGPFAAGPAGLWVFTGNRLQLFAWPGGA